LFAIVSELVLQAEVDLALGCETWVFSPHTRKRLANTPYDILHCSRSDRVPGGGNGACPISVGEDLEECHWVAELFQGRIDGEADAELGPFVPVSIAAAGSARRYPKSDLVLDNAEITAEVIGCQDVQRCQDLLCG
jgi:hypothetical protein